MCFAMTAPHSVSPDIVDELYGLADSLMQGSGKTVVISYANIRFAADEIKRLRASLQPATPTSCPYKGPFGCKCEPGECKYRAGGDAVAGEAKALAELLRAVKSCDSYVNPESGIAAKMAAYEDALRSTDVAATPSSREVSDERALDLARHIQDGDFTTEEAACEIMMYATDGAMQLKAAGYFDPAQRPVECGETYVQEMIVGEEMHWCVVRTIPKRQDILQDFGRGLDAMRAADAALKAIAITSTERK
jgi:hypothetical protein